MEKVVEYKEKLSSILAKYDCFNEPEKLLGVERVYIFLVGSFLISIILWLMGGAGLIVNLIGFIYPAYMSFKAISSKKVEDDTQWLTYWVVFAFFNITEQITDLFLNWIPFYFALKVAFLIWCYHPSTLGANLIYEKAIKPYLSEHMTTIDQTLKKAEVAAKEVLGKAK